MFQLSGVRYLAERKAINILGFAPRRKFNPSRSPMGSALVTIAPGGKNLQEGLRIAVSSTYTFKLTYYVLLV